MRVDSRSIFCYTAFRYKKSPARPTINDPAPTAAKLAPLEEDALEEAAEALEAAVEGDPAAEVEVAELIIIVESLPVIIMPDMAIPDMAMEEPWSSPSWAMTTGIRVRAKREKRIGSWKNEK